MSRASFRLYSEKLELLRGGASDDESEEKCRDMDPDRIGGSPTVLALRMKCPREALLPLQTPRPRLMPELAASPARAEDEDTDAVEA